MADRRRSNAFVLALAVVALFFGARTAEAQAFQVGLSVPVQTTAIPVPTSDWETVRQSGAEVVHLRFSLATYLEREKKLQISYDPYVRAAAQRNLTVLPYIYGAAQGPSPFPLASEFEKGATPWGEFLTRLAARYGPAGSFWTENPSVPYHPVTTWEIWNEENLSVNNPGKTTVQPPAYAEFLKFAYGRIRAAQGSAKVLMGGLIYRKEGSSTTGTINAPAYLSQLKAAEGSLGSYFTGASVHSYAENEESFRSSVSGFHYNLTSLFPGKPMWVQFGWPTEVGGEGVPAQTEEGQAELLRQSFEYLKLYSSYYGVEGVSWFQYRDNGSAWQSHTGLVNAGGGQKLAWFAYEEQTGHPFWPTTGSWSSENIGGSVTSLPDISSWEPGRFDVFAKGTSENLVHTWYTNGAWGPWQDLGGALTTGVGADSYQPGRIDVVGEAPDGTVGHWWWNGSVWGYDNLGGIATASPDISDWSSRHLDVFVRGRDGLLYHKYFISAWSGWERIGSVEMASGPSSVSWGPNRVDVVANLNDGTVGHWWWNGSGWGYDNLGGKLAPGSKPTIASTSSGQLDVFAQGVERGLVHDKWNGSSWSGWERIGGPIASSPGAVSPEAGRIDVVAENGDSSVEHYWTLTP